MAFVVVLGFGVGERDVVESAHGVGGVEVVERVASGRGCALHRRDTSVELAVASGLLARRLDLASLSRARLLEFAQLPARGDLARGGVVVDAAGAGAARGSGAARRGGAGRGDASLGAPRVPATLAHARLPSRRRP